MGEATKPAASTSSKAKPTLVTKVLAPARNPFFIGVLIIGFLGGIIGGAAGFFAMNNYFSLGGNNRSRQVVIEDSSAIIDVAKRMAPSVVSIVTQARSIDIFGRQLQQSGAGSGIIIRSDGLILTNKHVVPDGTSHVKVITNDGKEFDNARVVARDPLLDLAYVKIEGSKFTAAELGDSDQVVVGQRVVAIGNALGQFENTVTSGIISGTGRPIVAGSGLSEDERLQDLLQTDAAINPGNSGGPLVNINGQVIGINTAIAGGAQNIGFAIPINQAKAGIASVEDTGKLSKPYLGVRYVELNAELAKQHKLPVSEGAYVVGNGSQPAILPDSPAAKAGIKEGDIITKVDDKLVTKNESLLTLIGSHKVGDSITLTILRDKKEQQITVKLAELPQNQ